jgi:hypothetical protein
MNSSQTLVAAVSALDAGTAAIFAATIASVTLLLNSGLTQWLQYKRDRTLHQEQMDRDAKEYDRRWEEARETQQQYLEREEAAHQHVRQDARRDRLLASYVSVLQAASAYASAALALFRDLLPGEDVRERNIQVSNEMAKAEEGTQRALAQVHLEGASIEVISLFEDVRQTSTTAIAIFNRSRLPRSNQSAIGLAPDLDSLAGALDKLRERMRQELSALDEAR